MKKNFFLIESPPNYSSSESELTSSEEFKKNSKLRGRTGEFIKKKENRRDRSEFMVNKNDYEYEDFTQEKENPEAFDEINFQNSLNDDDDKKQDAYEIFSVYHKKYLKALEIVENIKKSPNKFKILVDDLKDAYEDLLKWDRKQARKYLEAEAQPGISITGYQTVYVDGIKKIKPKPIFVKNHNGGIQFSPTLADDLVSTAFRTAFYYPALNLNRGLEAMGRDIAALYNLSVEYVGKPLTPYIMKAIVPIADGLEKSYKFLVDNGDVIKANIRAGILPDEHNLKELEKAEKNRSIELKAGLNSDEVHMNRKASKILLNQAFNNDFYNEVEDDFQMDENNFKDLIKKNIENKLIPESEKNNPESQKIKNTLLKSFENITNFKNEKVSDLLEDSSKIDQIFVNTNTAIQNYKAANVNNPDKDFKDMTKLITEFEKFQQKIPEIKSALNSLSKAPDFEKIKSFYKNYGIFNLGGNQKILLNNFSTYVKIKSNTEEEVINNPLDISSSKLSEEVFKQNFALLGFKFQLMHLTIYYLNRFTENLMALQGQLSNSYVGKNYLSIIYTLNFKDLNLKIEKELGDKVAEESSLTLNDYINISNNIQLKGSAASESDDKFFSKENVLLSKEDKIVGMYCRKKNEEKVESIFNIADERMSSVLEQNFENNKQVIKKVVDSIRKIPIIDTLVLLSKNPEKDNDYFLYQIDISNLYEKFFQDENLLGYVVEFTKNIKNSQNTNNFEIELPVNSSEELENYKVLDLRKFIETSEEKKVSVKMQHPRTKENLPEISFKFEYFQFMNKKIENSLDPELNPVFLEDLFKLAGLEFLTNSNSIFKQV
jgi:hypothetical protein